MAKHIVVVGAGAVGACTAYFLAQKATPGLSVTVVEKTKVACAASGKAGGFLARDWCDGSAIGPIARKSFALHAELADKLDGKSKYGYRPVDTYSVFVQTGKKAGQRKPAAVESSTIEWVDNENIKAIQQLGTTSDTAQVHPGQFTNTVLGAAVDTGIVRVQCGTGVSGLLYSEEDGQTVVGVKLENGDTIQADAVIVCMGPWSGQLELKGSSRRVNALPIEGSRAHSIVCRPKLTVPAQALFTEIIEGRRSYSPEVYPRPDGTVYMCGATDDEPLPSSADQIKIDQEAIDQLKALKDVVSPQLEGEITAEQACYLPISRDGTPLIGMHPKYKQLYVATGHSCWGILNSPATGLMMAELVLNGEVDSIDERAVRSVDPRNRC